MHFGRWWTFWAYDVNWVPTVWRQMSENPRGKGVGWLTLYFLPKMLCCLLDSQIWWRYPRPRRAVINGRVLVWRFWPWTLTLTSQRLMVKFGTDAQRNWTYFSTSHNARNERTNEPTNQQTWPITIPPAWDRQHKTWCYCNPQSHINVNTAPKPSVFTHQHISGLVDCLSYLKAYPLTF